MIFKLSDADMSLLKIAGIEFSPQKDYSEDEAFEFLDNIYDREVYYAQASGRPARRMAEKYAQLAGKVQRAIPE